MCLQLMVHLLDSFYKVTAISTNLLTIARFNPQTGQTETGGLRHAIEDNAKVLRHWEYYFNFSGSPTTTDDVSNAGGSNDEMHIAVIDEDGSITGTAGTILETFEGVSQDPMTLKTLLVIQTIIQM